MIPNIQTPTNAYTGNAYTGANSKIGAVLKAKALRAFCAVIVMMGLTQTALAKDYIVEVVVFENSANSSITEPHAYQAPKKPRSRANTWLLSNQLLNDEASKISGSSDYVLRHHFAWGQESLPYSKSATYTVVENDTKGYIKVYADSLLFANIDLDYKGFRMVEKRRLKLNEKHFFDHPKFGLLLQVSRLEKKASSADQ